MSLTAIVVVVIILLLIPIIMWEIKREAIKSEKEWRHQHFHTIVAGKTTPIAAIEWLTFQLLGKDSIYPGNKHHFELTLADLDIKPEKYDEVVRHSLRLCWRELNMRKPTIKEAAFGQYFITSETHRLTELMTTHKITSEDLNVDIESVRQGYTVRCCEVLEEGLYRYPDRPFENLSAPKLMEVLKEIWVNPEPERVQKWQDWVLAAKKRHAYRLLVRLREGRYFFPDSDERVTRLLRYLSKAGATTEDIGTSDQELEELRGFRYKTKQNK